MLFLTVLLTLFVLLTIGGFMPNLSRKRKFSQSFSKAEEARVYHALVTAIKETSKFESVIECCDDCLAFLKSPSVVSFNRIFLHNSMSCSCDDEYYQIVQLQAFFKKRENLDLGIDTAGAALASFWRSEVICRNVNRSLDDRTSENYAARAALIFKMQRKISSLLGDVPSYDDTPFGFGPGATVGCSKNTSVRMKLTSSASSTVGAFSLLQGDAHMIQTWPGLTKVYAVRGSSWTTVPKTCFTDRAINIEPTVNSYLQKGYGSVIRSKLKQAGIDLNDQSVNQRLALYGSRTGELATIDLSMASDTIAYNLVRDLLPWPWFLKLDALRSPMTQLPYGKEPWVILEKFSSMGNGFTFELESLIFWALLSVVCDSGDTISVYGDDLICPSSKFEEVIAALELIGFVPNSEKSFGSGPFRESCGKDYWDGFEVRPVFCKKAMSVKELYRLHNFFYRDSRMAYLCPVILSFLTKQERSITGPDGYGDGHLLSNAIRVVNDKRGWDGRYCKYKTYSAVPRILMSSRKGDYGAFLYLNRGPTELQVSERMLYAERDSEPRYRLRTAYSRVTT